MSFRKYLGIIAGTPVDTEMGVNFVESRGFTARGRHLSPNPEKQAKMQVLEPQKLFDQTLDYIIELKNEGVEGVIIYCNSLCSSLKLEKLKKDSPIKIVTPLDIYQELAQRFQIVALLSGTNTSNTAIEKIMRENNSYITVLGFSLLPVISQIEQGLSPYELVFDTGISDIVKAISKLQAEALVLACTHFPYFEAELDRLIKNHNFQFQLINPSEEMVNKFIK